MGARFDFNRVQRFFTLLAISVISSLLLSPSAIADTLLSFGQVISASIDSPVENDRYIFEASAGDRVLVRMSTVDPSPVDAEIILYSPDGLQLKKSLDVVGPGAAEIASDPLPASGTYTILPGIILPMTPAIMRFISSVSTIRSWPLQSVSERIFRAPLISLARRTPIPSMRWKAMWCWCG